MLQGVIFLFSLGPEVFMDWLTMHLLLLCAAFFPPKHFSELWGEMPTGGSLVSCVAFDSAIPLLQLFLSCTSTEDPSTSLPWILCRCLWSGKKSFAYNKSKMLSKNGIGKTNPNKTEPNRCKRWKKMLSSENVPSGIVGLKSLLDIGQCRSWVLQGGTGLSWWSIHTLARNHRECGAQ